MSYVSLVNPVSFFKSEHPTAFEMLSRGEDGLAPEIDEIERRTIEAGRACIPGGKRGAYPVDLVRDVMGTDLFVEDTSAYRQFG